MARQPTSAMRAWFDDARATPILDVLSARQIRLRGGGVEKAGPCPQCGGRDRFAVNLRKNIFFCRQGCASGSPIDLVLFLDGGSERAAAEALTGRPPPDGASEALSPEEIAAAEAARATARAQADAAAAQWSERERAKLRRWWDRARGAPGTPVEAYLRLRGLSLPRGASLRYRAKHDLMHERELLDADGQPLRDAAGRPRREHFVAHTGPAMLAAIAGPDGHFAALHMTWLDLDRPDGKAVVACPYTGEILPAKKVRGSKTAGSIPLNRIAAAPQRLILGEGIETTLAVREALIREGADLSRTLFRSAVDLGNLGGKHLATVKHPTETYVDRAGRTRARLIPGPVPDLTAPAIAVPEGVAEIVTLGDGDSEAVLTRHAHARAAARWTTPACRVRAVFADPGTDFNTMLRAP